MEALDDFLTKTHFHIPWIGPIVTLFFPLGDFTHGREAQQFQITPHQFVGNRHDFAEHVVDGVGDADVIAQGFRHFLYPVQAFQQGHGQHDLGLLPVNFLQLPTHQQIEFLIRPAQFHVGLQFNGIIALDQWIEEFVNGDGLAVFITGIEIFPFQHPRHGVFGGQLNHVGRGHGIHP